MKKSFFVRLIICSFILSIILGCESKREENGEKLIEVTARMPIPIIEAGQTTFYAAQDQGYYKDEGLKVKFDLGSKELNPVKMVATGRDDFAILGGPDALLTAVSKGQKLKAIAIIHRNSNFPCLLTLKSSDITNLEQLNGAKVGFFYGHISTDVLRALFRENNVKITEVDVGFDYNQLINQKIEASWAFTVTAGLELPAKGVDINIISPADYGINTHGYTIFASEELINNEPETVLKFLRASLKGVKFTLENPDVALESLLKRDPKLDKDLNIKRQAAYNSVTSNSTEYPIGYMDYAMFKETYDRLVGEKVITESFDIKNAYTAKFLSEIYKKPFDD
jgi:ABC-type nitrate/sulfonate/bicarbonate transport system substrate-binding protein